MEVLLLHNENAGDGEHSRVTLTALLRDAGYTPVYRDLHETIGTPDLFSIGEFVAVAGGDGSIRKVALALLGHDRALAPLPLGTANNISRALGLDASLDQIVRGWSGGHRHRIDLGQVTGPWGRRAFIEGIGLGLMPRMISISNYIHPDGAKGKTPRVHKLSRDRSVLAALAHEVAARPTTLCIDDRETAGEIVLLEILNIDRVGPGVELAPDADPFDGRLDVVSITVDQRTILQNFLKASIDGASPPAKLPMTRGRTFRIVTRHTELRLDDEILPLSGETVLEVTISPAALELVLPAHG